MDRKFSGSLFEVICDAVKSFIDSDHSYALVVGKHCSPCDNCFVDSHDWGDLHGISIEDIEDRVSLGSSGQNGYPID